VVRHITIQRDKENKQLFEVTKNVYPVYFFKKNPTFLFQKLVIDCLYYI